MLYPTVAGRAARALVAFRCRVELACVRAYNDWLLEESGKRKRWFRFRNV